MVSLIISCALLYLLCGGKGEDHLSCMPFLALRAVFGAVRL